MTKKKTYKRSRVFTKCPMCDAVGAMLHEEFDPESFDDLDEYIDGYRCEGCGCVSSGNGKEVEIIVAYSSTELYSGASKNDVVKKWAVKETCDN